MSQFDTIEEVAECLREDLKKTKIILLFAYNGIGKTRISMAFKDQGKRGNKSDTLYFNAFTEDLFTWDNDLVGDRKRMLRLNNRSRFFKGLVDVEMETRIRHLLSRYANFDFEIDTDDWIVHFSRDVYIKNKPKPLKDIKVSRGEENIFIWCFFLAVVQLAMDESIETYSWVKYVYIDDPISSLDENNAVAVGHHLVQLLRDTENELKMVISSHHTLFFNVLYNELHSIKNKDRKRYFLSKSTGKYTLECTRDTPFFYHVAMLVELKKAADTNKLYTYHFNMLRIILEKTASFHGYEKFIHCIRKDDDDPDGTLRKRLIDILSHGNYSLYEPMEMVQDNKDIFKKILDNFLEDYNFNKKLLRKLVEIQEEI